MGGFVLADHTDCAILLTGQYMSAESASEPAQAPYRSAERRSDPSDNEGLRSRILAAATAMFASRGFAATSTREVVEAAGCTKPALYYYFKNKEALFREAVAEAHERLDHADDEARDAGSVRQQILVSLRLLAHHVVAYPEDLRLVFRAESYSSLQPELVDTRPLRASHLAMVEALLQQGIDSGELRASLPLEDAAISLVGMLHFELQLHLDGRPLADDFAERIVSIYMDGVAK